MKRKNIYLIFFASLFSLTMAGCCDTEPQDYYILDWNPIGNFKVTNVYTANFINSKGAQQQFNSIVYKQEMLTNEDCKECCDKFQTLKVVYDGAEVSYNFSINIEAKSASGLEGLSIYYVPKYSLNLIYHNADIAYIENESLNRVLANKNTYSELLDSVQLNNTVFYDVFKFKASVATNKLYPTELFYTKSQGIVGYLMSDSTVYYLNN